MSFLDLVPRSFTYENKNLLFSETTGPFPITLCMLDFRYKEINIHEHDAGHMTKMAPCPYMVKQWADLNKNLE